MKTFKTSIFSLAVATLLAACGGGSSDGSQNPEIGTNPPVTPPLTPVIPPITPPIPPLNSGSTIQTQVLPATYAAGTEQRNAYDYLNAQRLACGFGLLQQDTKLDIAAQGHASYLSYYHLLSHYQDKNSYPNGFTGTTLADRINGAGYVFTTGAEVLTAPYSNEIYQSYGTSYGQSAVMDLFSTPYHGNGMLEGDRDIGIGFGITGMYSRRVVIDIGSTSTRIRQQMAEDQVMTYPCAGTSGILSKTYANEVPSPIPGRNLISEPIGHPIYIKVKDGNTLILSSYSLRKIGTNIDIPLQLLNKGNDLNGLITSDSEAILIPLVPLDKNYSYEFKSTGTNNGKSINIEFNFSSGEY